MQAEQVRAVIVDNGSGTCKAGLTGDDGPSVRVTTSVGRTGDSEQTVLVGNPLESYISNEVQLKREALSLKYPIERGVVTDWDDMEILWRHLFTSLDVSPEAQPVLLTEAPLSPAANRERMSQIMFESFDTPAMYSAIQAVLGLYAAGRLVGVALDCGDGVSHAVPINEGYAIKGAIQRLDLAGRDLTDHLQKLLLEERGYHFTTPAERSIVGDIKEKLSFVALDYEKSIAEPSNKFDKIYTLPDGQLITVGPERFRCAEALFNPSTVLGSGAETLGLHHLINNAINSCDQAVRASLFGSLVPCGGSTMIDGIRERLTKELEGLVPAKTKVKIFALPQRQNSVWVGGALLAALSTFQEMWITRDEYNETGPSIVHRKLA